MKRRRLVYLLMQVIEMLRESAPLAIDERESQLLEIMNTTERRLSEWCSQAHPPSTSELMRSRFAISFAVVLLIAVGCSSVPKEQHRFSSVCPHCQDARPKTSSKVRIVGTNSVSGGRLLNRAVHIQCPTCGKKYVAKNQKVIREVIATELEQPPRPARTPLIPPFHSHSITNASATPWETFAVGTTRTNYPASPTNKNAKIHGRAGKVGPRVYVQPSRMPLGASW